MKKIRYFPFGYMMINGEIQVVPKESALIEQIYKNYLSGLSLLNLAELAQKSGLRFRENAESWNKNIIARILDDSRYWNSIEFPVIIKQEIAIAVSEMRAKKTTSKSPVWFVQKKLICPYCNAPLSRNSRNTPRIRWDCKSCGQHCGPSTDKILMDNLFNKFLELYRNPQLAVSEANEDKRVSLQAVRLSNEINQELSQRQVNSEKLLSLILECAAEKYSQCSIKESDSITLKIIGILESMPDVQNLNSPKFNEIVDNVIIRPDCTVQLKLINQRII